MDPVVIWFLLAGLLLISVALTGTLIARLPITTAMLYVGVGILMGSQVSGLLQLDPLTHATPLERLTEIALIVSLFTAGLKLRVPVSDRRWLLAVRLAVISMAATVGLVATVLVVGLGASWGFGILVGAILAPTDPVLASDVQVEHPFDENRLRFALTGEASLNDGTAFPFVMLGLGLLGAHDLGAGLTRWVAVDLVWASAAGVAIGGALGTAIGTLVLYLRQRHREAVGFDDFVALGLVALTYGAALACHASGFLAVFAAGLALRRVERLQSGPNATPAATAIAPTAATAEEVATHPVAAPAYLARAVLAFNEQLERIGEVVIVVIIGAMLSRVLLSWHLAWFVPLFFLVIRPVSVAAGLVKSDVSGRERALIAWFGIRGVGSAYYLLFAITHGLPGELTTQVVAFTLTVVACSIVLHGSTATMLMTREDQAGGGQALPSS